jgi:hypothetical protein
MKVRLLSLWRQQTPAIKVPIVLTDVAQVVGSPSVVAGPI